MSVIPVNPNNPLQIQSILEISRNHLPISSLVKGETLTVTILEKISSNQYLVNLKNTSIAASSEVPLHAGEKLQVRVQSVQPQLVLNVIDLSGQKTDTKINEGFLQWRLNPDSLVEVLSKVNDFSRNLKSSDLPLSASIKDIDNLLSLFNRVIFSSETKNNPFFVKEFISKLGLMLENDLEKIATGTRVEEKTSSITDNLKTSLLKLSLTLSEALKENSELDAQIVSRLKNLASFTSDALQAIESRQAVNILYQRNESGLYLQIPLSLGESLRQAEIFITPDHKKADVSKRYSSVSIMIYLDLDYLGNIAVNATVRQGYIRCIIQCESDEVRQIFAGSLDVMKKALSDIGYSIETIDCMTVREIKRRKAEYLEQQILGSTELVDSFV